MATKTTSLAGSRVSLTAKQVGEKIAFSGVIKAVRTKSENPVSSLRAYRAEINRTVDVILQENEGKGKRFAGAKNCEPQELLRVYTESFDKIGLPPEIV